MKHILIIAIATCLFACNIEKSGDKNADAIIENGTKSEENTAAIIEKPLTASLEIIPEEIRTNFFGSYTGDFEALEYKEGRNISWTNRITLFVDSIVVDSIYGRSIVSGNFRPFKGTIKDKHVMAKEPGDHKYDGSFAFTFNDKGATVKGTWTANDQGLGVTKRKFDLGFQKFTYKANLELPEDIQWDILYDSTNPYLEGVDEAEMLTEDVFKFNPSKVELKPEDIQNMYKGDLEVMRNSIYARHGYSFANRKMRYVFQYVDWYMPVTTDVRDKLTPLEIKNIDLLKRYEDHADRYYDAFGR